MKMKELNIGVIQMKSEPGKYQENMDKVKAMIADCAAKNCQLVCLPEAFATTIDFGALPGIAQSIPGEITDALSRLARKYGIDIIAGILEAVEENIYSSVAYIDSGGSIRSVYRRVNVYELEKKFLAKGNELAIVNTKWGKIGLLGGYDINFPEVCRRYFEEKTELMVCLCQIPDTFLTSTVTIAKARASENNCYFVLASNIGKNGLARIDFMGNSMIAQGGDVFDFASGEYIPQEEILAIAGQEETVLTARLNMRRKNLEIVRNPHMLDKRADYSSLEVKYAE
jgi:predicted amidohydrolase